MVATGLRRIVGLTVLLCAGSLAPALPAAPPSNGRVVGRVLIVRAAGDTVPVPHPSVVEMRSHRDAITDWTGAFALVGIPSGRVVLAIHSFGSHKILDTLDLAAGQTVRRDYLLSGPRFEAVRDSLAALGQWPPALDPALLDHMRKAHDVRVFRLDPSYEDWTSAPDPKHRVAAWRIVNEGHRPSHHNVEQLAEAMRSRPYRLNGFEMYYDGRGAFRPDVGVRFTHDGVPVDVLLCYTCDALSIWRAGEYVQSADLKDWRFFAFGLHAFPHDATIRKLTDPRIPHYP